MYDNLEYNAIKLAVEKIIGNKVTANLKLNDNKIAIILEAEDLSGFDQKDIINQIKQALKFAKLEEINVVFSNHKKMSESKSLHHIPNIEKIILFAAAKGGVGKSTTATNTALALANLGFKVGIVDADIYGPTIPNLLGIKQKPEIEENKMLPINSHGIYSISIGYLIDENQAAIWRGPMISKTLYQLLIGVKWPKLDYLIIDMPPGTGDIYLSLAENFIVDGVVLLTTPQKIAKAMLKKSISFFGKTNIPIIGVVENMSYFFDSQQNVTHNIFGQHQEEWLNSELLAQIPLIAKISDFSDAGKSLVDEKEFELYLQIAKKIDVKLNKVL